MRAKTWVLILSSTSNGWPAVIGGYLSPEDAEAAGREAIMAHLTQEQFEEENYGTANWDKWGAWVRRPWGAFTVIPGAAQ